MGMLETHDGTIVSPVETQKHKVHFFFLVGVVKVFFFFYYDKYREKRIPCFKWQSVALTTVLHSVLQPCPKCFIFLNGNSVPIKP